MAYALVKASTAVTGASGASVTPVFGQATAAGNLLIAWVATTAGTAAITTTSGGWTRVSDPGGVDALVAIFYKANSSASETAPTFTATGATFMWAALAEFSGGATTTPLDQSSSASGTTSPQVVAVGAADAASGELLVSAEEFALSNSGTHTSTDTYNNGATPTTNFNNDSTSTKTHYRFAWGTTTGNSAADQNSITSNSAHLSTIKGVVASFKLASSSFPGSNTQAATARLQNTITKTQTATARIQTTATHTQSAIAQIRATATKTQAATARIQATTSKTQTATAHIQSYLWNNAEGGTNGVQPTISDTGSGNAFTAITIGATATLVYSNAAPIHGSLAYQFATRATADKANLVWAHSSLTTSYGRMGFLVDNLASATHLLQWRVSNGGVVLGYLSVTAGGNAIIRNGADIAVWTSTTVLSINTKYRFEWSVNPTGDGNSSIQVKIFNGDSTTALEDSGVQIIPVNTGGGTPTTTAAIEFGIPNNSSNTPSATGFFYLDDLIAGASTWPGPAGLGRTQTSIARVQNTAMSKTQASVSRIQSTAVKTQTATAHIAANVLTKTQTATARIIYAPPVPVGSLLFGDDFTGASIDTTKWAAKTGSGSSGTVWGGFANASVDGASALLITATGSGSTGSGWTSAFLSAKSTSAYSGPRYMEARAICPGGSGPWSAPIWEWDSPFGVNGYENDVNEQLGFQPTNYHTTAHSDGTHQDTINNNVGVTLANAYHQYGAAVYPDHIDYYFDSTKIQTITSASLPTWPFVSNSFVANIDLQMGGWGGTISVTGPQTMYVDYFKVWALGDVNIQTATARIRNTVTAPQTATARIQNTVTKAQTAVARIQVTGTKTQPAIARIGLLGSKTQPAIARIQTTVTKTQPAVARIQKTITKTQTAHATVQNIATKTHPAVARIQVTGTKTQISHATIQNIATKTHTAISRIQIAGIKTQISHSTIQNAAIRTQTAIAHIVAVGSFTKNQTAIARIQNVVTKVQTAVARIQITPNKTQTATARIKIAGLKTQTAIARVQKIVTKTQLAASRVQKIISDTQPAVARIKNTVTKVQIATAHIVVPGVQSKTQTTTARIQSNLTRTQSAIARIQVLKTKMQSAIARISSVVIRTQPATARIEATTSKTQTAIATIVIIRTATITATASIRNTASKTQTAKARIISSIVTPPVPNVHGRGGGPGHSMIHGIPGTGTLRGQGRGRPTEVSGSATIRGRQP